MRSYVAMELKISTDFTCRVSLGPPKNSGSNDITPHPVPRIKSSVATPEPKLFFGSLVSKGEEKSCISS